MYKGDHHLLPPSPTSRRDVAAGVGAVKASQGVQPTTGASLLVRLSVAQLRPAWQVRMDQHCSTRHMQLTAS
ncbi:hypothetical protein NDU88_005164 [Pleurodeles waltl]|uniref:Uncharacterized protein n=1 Tax=Pleurodeles waltl TaxID=8319 RepID=A0AAV7PEQ3_PLEWA|nr:hypothetical protein NDU88_005164 [Pleurodeles waltl]